MEGSEVKMNFLVFIGMYLLCTLFLMSIGILIFKLIIKKKCFDVSKYAEKEIDKYFNGYDDNINELLKDMEEGEVDNSVNTFDR